MRQLHCFFVLLLFITSLEKVRSAPSKYKTILDMDFDAEEELDDEEDDDRFNQESIFQQGETRDFLRFLRAIKYDHRQCPEGPNGGPVEVKVSIVVSNIRSVSEITMDYALEIFYRESWRDPRLKYQKDKFKNKTEISLHESYSNFLWHPDTFVPNAIASKNPRKQSVTHRSLLRLREDGRILFSRRLSLVLSCAMDLTLFPFDTQLCKLGIESYGHTADLVRYAWSTGDISALRLQKVSLPDYRIQSAFVTSRMEKYATGDYSRLYVCFLFSRAAGFCFLQLIVPSTAVVITSWVCLWMENETSFQDMISIILTITFLLFSYNEVMPRVSYLKAMDVYLGVCFCIVFFSLIKLAILKYMQQQLRKNTGCLPPSLDLSGPRAVTSISNGGCLPLDSSRSLKNGRDATRDASRTRRSCYTSKCVRAFQWTTQVLFISAFVSFCFFFYLAYPNVHQREPDIDCEHESAEFHAEVL